MPDASTRFVTAATFRSAGAAHLARTRLQAAGIEAMVVNESSSGLTPFHDASGASVKLRVSTDELARAQQVLEEADGLENSDGAE